MRIALIGAHPATRLGAPFQNKDWTVWACSALNMGVLPRCDAWFELHTPLGLDVRSGNVLEKYTAWLQRQRSVYIRDPNAQFPGAIPYPEEALKARFGPFFFTSSIAYMMALAVSKLPEEIALWGVGMHKRDEYENQRPGLHYFVQRAWDAGIKVTVPPKSRLLEPSEEKW